MATLEQSEDGYVKRVYRRIIALALAARASYVVIFALLGISLLAVYNVFSVLFYCGMLHIVSRGWYRLAVSSIHLEVCAFVLVSTLMAGWEIGIALYLVALTSLTYFCPFEHKYVPYLFAALEILIFLLLRFYTGFVRPGVLAVSQSTALYLYLYNACACFFVILYAAFSSKVSAAVSRQQLQAENHNLSVLANYDELTGLLSRRALLNRLEQVPHDSVVLVLGDIDDFKTVNDTWGHVCGDQVLSEFADLMRQQLDHDAAICRWGGEEFVLLFQDLPQEEVYAKVQTLCDTIAQHSFRFGEEDLHITMTFGIGPRSNGISVEELVSLADERMYTGKSQGKNQVL